jgi:hypothetical protein
MARRRAASLPPSYTTNWDVTSDNAGAAMSTGSGGISPPFLPIAGDGQASVDE